MLGHNVAYKVSLESLEFVRFCFSNIVFFCTDFVRLLAYVPHYTTRYVLRTELAICKVWEYVRLVYRPLDHSHRRPNIWGRPKKRVSPIMNIDYLEKLINLYV